MTSNEERQKERERLRRNRDHEAEEIISTEDDVKDIRPRSRFERHRDREDRSED